MNSEDRDGPPVAGHGRRISRSVAIAMAALLTVFGLVACGGGNKNKGQQAGNVSKASGKELVKLLGYTNKDRPARWRRARSASPGTPSR